MLPTAEDRGAISDLLARYCLSLDTDDVEGWVALFTPDARYEVYGRTFDGHGGLRRMLGGAPGGLHLGGPAVIEMTAPDRARTMRNLLFVDRRTGASRSAVYTDELHRTADGWRIAHCRCWFIVAGGLGDRPDRQSEGGPGDDAPAGVRRRAADRRHRDARAVKRQLASSVAAPRRRAQGGGR